MIERFPGASCIALDAGLDLDLLRAELGLLPLGEWMLNKDLGCLQDRERCLDLVIKGAVIYKGVA